MEVLTNYFGLFKTCEFVEEEKLLLVCQFLCTILEIFCILCCDIGAGESLVQLLNSLANKLAHACFYSVIQIHLASLCNKQLNTCCKSQSIEQSELL